MIKQHAPLNSRKRAEKINGKLRGIYKSLQLQSAKSQLNPESDSFQMCLKGANTHRVNQGSFANKT